MTSTRRRALLLSVLSVVSFILALAATLMVFAQDRIFDADSFSTTAASTLTDPAVNDYLAEAVSEALIDQAPNLAIGGPLLADVTGAVLESTVATRVVEGATREAHLAIFERSDNSVVLELSDLVVSIEQALAAISPDLAEAIPEEVSTLSVEISSGEFAAPTVRLAERLRLLTFVLVVLTAGLLIALVVLESNLYHGLARMGLVLGSAGLSLVVLRGVGASVLASYGRTPIESGALVGAWNVVLGDLASWGWSMIVAGAFLAGLGWAVLHAGRLDASVRELGRRLPTEPDSIAGRAGRTIALLTVAGWALVEPRSLIEALIRCAGFALALGVIAYLVDRLGVAERLKTLQPATADVVPLRSVASRSIVPIVIMLGLGAFGAALLSNNNDASALADPDACNGHVELCERRLDQVTMATAHNAMSSTATGFYLPNHLSTMRAQLDHGVRGFMIDTVYGRRASDGTVRTSLDLVDVETLDRAALGAAEAVQARQGADLGVEAVYLCHGFCEIGALDAVTELTSLREWLDDNPREVVVLVVQDATTPEDTAAIFEDAGFADLVHTQTIDAVFPTLGEMIELGRRVFVMVEEDDGDIEWLHPAFEFSQETPFSFASADDFSCAANRGSAQSPLFVVNHFITLAQPRNQTINDYDQLSARLEDCQSERGRQPNLLAVDFITKGDVMAVVDSLNGVGD